MENQREKEKKERKVVPILINQGTHLDPTFFSTHLVMDRRKGKKKTYTLHDRHIHADSDK